MAHRSSLLLRTMTTTSAVPNPPDLIKGNLQRIAETVRSEYESAPPSKRASACPRLVAVSKTKHKGDVISAYQAGHRHFGENYVQELLEKCNDPEVLEKCPDIRWHFIGNLQSGKTAKFTKGMKNVSCIETISSAKLADKLQSAMAREKPPITVDVFIQVNTSLEENKNGVAPGPETLDLSRHILEKCPNLVFKGLMTIGDLGNSKPSQPRTQLDSNPDFLSLIKCRKEVCDELNLAEANLELSMGMSNDYEEAIRMGSTNVRVGSSIFGARNYPSKPSTEISDSKPVNELTDKLKEATV